MTAVAGTAAAAGPASGASPNGPTRTIFFGSGSFAVPILDAVAENPRLVVVAVVTAPDRPAGRRRELRRTPVAERAAALGLRLVQPPRLRAAGSVAELAALEPELGILADYGQIVPREVLELPALGILNVHPSALPRHRGAAPIQATIADGDARAGVSIIVMDEGVDTGPILAIADWPLAGSERAAELEAHAATAGASLLGQVLGSWLDRSAVPEPQEVTRATTTRPLQREDGRLDPGRPAEELERRVRAYDPWPGAFVETDVGRVIIGAASVAPSQSDDVPGMLVEHDRRLALATHQGRLVLESAQREGRGPVAGEDFLRGQRRLLGSLVRPASREGAG